MKLFLIYSTIVIFLLVSGCTDSSGPDYLGELYVKLVDAPVGYDHINVYFQRIDIHLQDETVNTGWRPVTEQDQQYDILLLRNGNYRWLVAKQVAIGTYDKIRIIFNYGSIVINGQEYALKPDTSIRNGLIINHPFTINEGQRFQLTLEMILGYSFTRQTDLGVYYYFHPRFRIQETSLSGSILGAVLAPDTSGVLATISTVITQTSDTVSTLTDPTSGGSFQIADIPEGLYSVRVIPSDTLTFRRTTVDSILVTRLTQVQIPTIVLQYK